MKEQSIRGAPHRSRQLGVSLVELMVGLALGMFIVAGLGYLYVGSVQVFRALEASSRVQENVRYAFERISTDVRMTGHTGCSWRTQANVLNGSDHWSIDLFNRPVRGFEDSTAAFPTEFAAARQAGDALVVLRADTSREYIIDEHNPSAASMTLMAAHDLVPGQIVVATDCSRHAALFQLSNANGANKTLVHNTGNSVSPGNCSKGLGSPVVCTSLGTSYEFTQGSRLFRLSGAAYYIGLNAAGERTLYRQAVVAAGGNSQLAPQEVLSGIEDMQVRYGVDTSPTPDGSVDLYTTADQVIVEAPGTDDDERWRRVLAVRISLVAIAGADQQVGTQVIPYVVEGETRTPADRRARKVFVTTIAIRNRL